MKNETYNGWTNYATWRINIEIFDGLRSDMDDETFTAEGCEDYANEVVFMECEESLAMDYARAFMSEVNWHEIAEALNEE